MSRYIGYFRELLQLLGFRTFLPTLFFNFYHLPLRQAIKLPIWINKPRLVKINKGGEN